MNQSESKTSKQYNEYQKIENNTELKHSQNLKVKTSSKQTTQIQNVNNARSKAQKDLVYPGNVKERPSEKILKTIDLSRKSQTSRDAVKSSDATEKLILIKKGRFCKIIRKKPSIQSPDKSTCVSSSTTSSKDIKLSLSADIKDNNLQQLGYQKEIDEYFEKEVEYESEEVSEEEDSQKGIECDSQEETEIGFQDEVEQRTSNSLVSQESFIEQDDINDDEYSLQDEISIKDKVQLQHKTSKSSGKQKIKSIGSTTSSKKSYFSSSASSQSKQDKEETELYEGNETDREKLKPKKIDVLCANLMKRKSCHQQSRTLTLSQIINNIECNKQKICSNICAEKPKRRMLDREEERMCIEINSLINQRILDYKCGSTLKNKCRISFKRDTYFESLLEKKQQYNKYKSDINRCVRAEIITEFENNRILGMYCGMENQKPYCTCSGSKYTEPYTNQDGQFQQTPHHTICEYCCKPKPCYMCYISKRLGSCVIDDNQSQKKGSMFVCDPSKKDKYPCHEEQHICDEILPQIQTSITDSRTSNKIVVDSKICEAKGPCRPYPICAPIICCAPDQSFSHIQQQKEYDTYWYDQESVNEEYDETEELGSESEQQSWIWEMSSDKSTRLTDRTISVEMSEILSDIKNYEDVDNEIDTEDILNMIDSEQMKDMFDKTSSENTSFDKNELELEQEISDSEDKLISEQAKSDSELFIKSVQLSEKQSQRKGAHKFADEGSESSSSMVESMSYNVKSRQKVCQEIPNKRFEQSLPCIEDVTQPSKEYGKEDLSSEAQPMRQAPRRLRCDQLADMSVKQTILKKHPEGFCVVVNDASKPGEIKLLTAETTLNEIKYSRHVRSLKDRDSQQIRQENKQQLKAVCDPTIECPKIDNLLHFDISKQSPETSTTRHTSGSSRRSSKRHKKRIKTSQTSSKHEDVRELVSEIEGSITELLTVEENQLLEEVTEFEYDEQLLEVLSEEHSSLLEEMESIKVSSVEKKESSKQSLSSIIIQPNQMSQNILANMSSEKQISMEKSPDDNDIAVNLSLEQISDEAEHDEQYTIRDQQSKPMKMSDTKPPPINTCSRRPFFHV